jgi:uncharacterized membrane protein
VALLLALCSAIAYGVSDFVGGVLTRRASVWAVAATSQGVAALITSCAAAARPGTLDLAAQAWGVPAGLGGAAGYLLIYQGLASGRMTVVAPLSAITAAAIPVIAGLATGERPAALSLIGVGLAVPAIWLITGSGRALGQASRRDLAFGLGAGLAFGVQFSSLGQVPGSAGLLPLAVGQLISAFCIVLAATAVSAPWIPRTRHAGLGAAAGLLAGVATICFQLAVQVGMLSIGGAVASLYPAFTVLLAAVVLRERIQGAQGIGLGVAAAAIALIAAA